MSLFNQQEGFSPVELNGVTLWLPPAGYVYDYLRGELVEVGVAGEGRPREQQHWRRPRPPKDYEERVRAMEEERRRNPDYQDPVVSRYRHREWQRRLYGYWFMNDGEPTFITGLHYFYLTHYRIDIGYPSFRITDQEVFWFWDYCVGNPNCLGMMLLTRRRYGKSYIGGAILAEYATRMRNVHCGLQSKEDDHAADVFQKAIHYPVRNLPDFFLPDHDQRVTSRWKFTKLDSIIDYRSSVATAYDGYKLMRYMCDEFGKTVKADVMERHRIVKLSLMLEDRFVGRAFYCTTVEDIDERNAQRAQELAEQSDHIHGLHDDGQTTSGLFRMIVPAYRSMNFDKYGRPDEHRNMVFITKERQKMLESGDQRGYLGVVRRYPNTYEEVFMTLRSSTTFGNLSLDITNRIEVLRGGVERKAVVRGFFEWVDDERRRGVIFRKAKEGPWMMLKSHAADSETFKSNKVAEYGTEIWPEGTSDFGIGVDPYAKSMAGANKPSQGAIAVFRKLDLHRPDISDMFVALYLDRPPTLHEFYEEVLKAAFYFGCPFLAEVNVSGLIEYAQSVGFNHFVQYLPGKRTPGISSNRSTKPRMVSLMEGYLLEAMDKIFFERLLIDLLQYDMDDSHKYDMAMAAMIALVACERARVSQAGTWGAEDANTLLQGKTSKTRNRYDISELFQ
ncbi:MAG: hypothetical protein D6746_01115 [Bacteroidetes bacterium]|nr:MAG: hypothetical protein D6746_01115 [Bacteroidota bacterium]